MATEELINSRRKIIEDIQNTVSTYESQLNKILLDFNWTKEGLLMAHHAKNTSGENVTKFDKTDEERMENYYLLPSGQKLKRYVESRGHIESSTANHTDLESTSIDLTAVPRLKEQASFPDMNKLKRDLKRRRMKYRTTKAPPLTYSEELRELIALQMEMFDKK